jgi:hypothetical protein
MHNDHRNYEEERRIWAEQYIRYDEMCKALEHDLKELKGVYCSNYVNKSIKRRKEQLRATLIVAFRGRRLARKMSTFISDTEPQRIQKWAQKEKRAS